MSLSSPSAPRFGGFYHVNASVGQLKQMPLGKAHGVPFLPCEGPGMKTPTWVYVFPQHDKKLETALNRDKVQFSYHAEEDIVARYAQPDETPMDISSESQVENIRKLLVRWANDALTTLRDGQLNDAFHPQQG